MDNNYVIQSLINSFETLKGNWQTKAASLINCIVNMERYNPQLSMDMWEALLADNYLLLGDDSVARCLVYDVMDGFYEKHHVSCNDQQECQNLYNHLFSHIANNTKLISYIFKDSYDCGSFNLYYIDQTRTNFIPICIASIIISRKIAAVKTLIKSIGQNTHLNRESIGTLFSKADKYVKSFVNDAFFANHNYIVADEVKEAMLNSVDSIADPESRAECTISILSF